MYILILLLSLQQILFGGTQEDTANCPIFFTKCKSSNKCIPNEWICDGHPDSHPLPEVGSKSALTYGRLCPIRPLRRKIVCDSSKFQCLNGQCLTRIYHCQSSFNCSDNSDERYCDTTNCPVFFTKCKSSNKCIPNEWICDGHPDCPSSEDENECENLETYSKSRQALDEATRLNLEFLHRQSNRESATEKWGSSVDEMAVMLHLVDDSLTDKETRKEVAYEVSIQLLSRLLKTKLQDISSITLASFVNALIVSCTDPRKFHGIDIVQELRNRVDQKEYESPHTFLSLCLAGDPITESDRSKLVDTFWNRRRLIFPQWNGQAMAVMALICASKQPGNELDMDTLRNLTMEIKRQQNRNGSFGSTIRRTALVIQALMSADPDADSIEQALNNILQSQEPNGSFGSLENSNAVLPVLNCKTLLDINTNHC